jgi:O-antigen/teichoic acid export membrane protein
MIKRLLGQFKKSGTARESGMLFFAEGFGLVFSILIYLVRPKLLTVAEIGLISYVVSLAGFFSGFFSFGLDNTGARLILHQPDVESKKRLAGMILLIGMILCALFSLFMFAASLFIPYFGRKEALPLLYNILPFVGYNILLIIYNQICYALGTMKQAAAQLFLYSFLYFLLMLALNYLGVYTVKTAIISEFGLHMLVVAVPVIFLYFRKLRFHKELWGFIKKEQKEKGWKIYLSRVIFIPSFNMDTLILGFFHSLDSVAHYTLSATIASPISIIGKSVSQSLYRKFSDYNKIEEKKVILLSVITLGAAVCCYIAGVIVVKRFLGKSYYPMLSILPLAIVVAIIRGINNIYISFMNAKGLANQLKNCAIIGLVANIIFNFGLIIPFGAVGGVYASIIVLGIIFMMRIYYCNQYTKGQLVK